LFLAFTTIVLTLVGQGLTLPFFVRRFASKDDVSLAAEVAAANLRISQAARERLREMESEFTTTQEWEAASRLIGQLDQRMNESRRRLDGAGSGESESDSAGIDRRLRAAMFATERDALNRMRRAGEISDRAYRHVQYNIDLLESFVTQSA
jgi:CPA1 family monovalent cation:H+ antiporter